MAGQRAGNVPGDHAASVAERAAVAAIPPWLETTERQTLVEQDSGPRPPAADALGRAMSELVLGSRTAAAFDVCRVVDAAARHLGLRRVDLFLVDYAQRYLLSIDRHADHADIPIEGTVAGRAFVGGLPVRARHGVT